MSKTSHRYWYIFQVGAGLFMLLGLLAISVGLGVPESGVVSIVLIAVGASLFILAGVSRSLFSSRIIKPRHYSGVAQMFLGVGFFSLLSLPSTDGIAYISTALLGLFSFAYGLATLYRPTWVNAPEDGQSSQNQVQ